MSVFGSLRHRTVVGRRVLAVAGAAVVVAAGCSGATGSDGSPTESAASTTVAMLPDETRPGEYPAREDGVAEYAGDASLAVVQYNAGSDGQATEAVSSKATEVVEFLAGEILAGRPDVIAVQEVCESQIVLLAELLAAEDFAVDYEFGPGEDIEGAAEACGALAGRDVPAEQARSGLAVLVRAPMVSAFRYHDVPGDESTVTRAVCAHTARPTTVQACVTRLADGAAGDEQLGQLSEQWQLEAPMLPTIVVGDLGVEPSAERLSSLYSSPVGDGVFHEVGMCGAAEPAAACPSPARQGAWTWEGGADRLKTDYVFVDAGHFAAEVASRVVVDGGECGGLACSDHRLLWGWVSLRVTPDVSGTQCDHVVMTAADFPADVFVRGGEVPCFEATRIMQDYYLRLAAGAAPGMGGGGPVEVGTWMCSSGPATAPGTTCVREDGVRTEAVIWP
ncbi:metal-dependent hydrolase [Actinoalloteichus sp. GBA129-24]|nr:metal-dependent hydrolase [Actinoalloteichus sp. GBA129-24]